MEDSILLFINNNKSRHMKKIHLFSHSILLILIILLGSVGFTQNVGIGTTTPSGRLQVNHRSSITHPGILLQDSTGTRSGLLRFKSMASAKYMQIWGFYDGNFSSNQYLDILSDSTFIATFRGNGNFGIGVGTPAYPLDVNGAINSTSEYRLSGKTILHWGDAGGLYRNLMAGDSAGFSNTGYDNTFIGARTGVLNTSGFRNSFFGSLAGHNNVGGHDNIFIGTSAGYINSSGWGNTFVGNNAGASNETGAQNLFFGQNAGTNNISGVQNTYLGLSAGHSSETSIHNVFVGYYAGTNNISGNRNTLLGALADVGSPAIFNATAIGFNAYVTQSHSLVLGSISGVNGAVSDTWVGIGTTAPTERLDIVGNLKVSGEVNRPSTGATNLLPIAFGSISSTGVINSGSNNFTVTRTAAGSYNIDIANQSFGFSTYSTVITPVGGPLVAGVDSASGNLLVRLYNLSGTLTDGTFSFVIYKQ
jgi:hypothetical protein